MDHLFATLDFWQKELLLFASICFLVGAVDDFVFDLLWAAHKARRRFLAWRKIQPAVGGADGGADTAGPLAVFVPAWHEADVIGNMLGRCLRLWNGHAYRIYVGCYPNDEQTIAAVRVAARETNRIRLVLCANDGPTTKADCLNRLWSALCRDEIDERRSFRAVILHDAEDLVHADELALFDRLIDRAALVQLPVVPRRAARSRWIAGHYGDEFAELHGKQMVLREALGVAIPSAGVGCAFATGAMRELARAKNGEPFDAQSVTEDYELGLHLTKGSARGVFVRVRDGRGQLVATQEFFPDNLGAAIRQKSRWMLGIALSGWDRLGWQTGWLENWMRLRDRKASFAAMVLAAGYVAAILTVILVSLDMAGAYEPAAIAAPLQTLLLFNALFLIWRLSLKALFVFEVYGRREALLSVPRTFVANMVNILAAGWALLQYLRLLSGGSPVWDKTRHFHPAERDIAALKNSNAG